MTKSGGRVVYLIVSVSIKILEYAQLSLFPMFEKKMVKIKKDLRLQVTLKDSLYRKSL